MVALLSPIVFIPTLTYVFGPENYDYESMKAIRRGDDHDLAAEAGVDIDLIPGEAEAHAAHTQAQEEEEQKHLRHAAFISRTMTVIMTICLLVLWPMPMFGSKYIFSKQFFTGWVSVGIIWLFFSSAMVGIYPLWEGRKTIAHTMKSIFLDLTGKKARVAVTQGVEASLSTEGVEVQTSEKMPEKV